MGGRSASRRHGPSTPTCCRGLLFPIELITRINGSNPCQHASASPRRPFSGYFQTFGPRLVTRRSSFAPRRGSRSLAGLMRASAVAFRPAARALPGQDRAVRTSPLALSPRPSPGCRFWPGATSEFCRDRRPVPFMSAALASFLARGAFRLSVRHRDRDGRFAVGPRPGQAPAAVTTLGRHQNRSYPDDRRDARVRAGGLPLETSSSARRSSSGSRSSRARPSTISARAAT
jgi:hypothetical protein